MNKTPSHTFCALSSASLHHCAPFGSTPSWNIRASLESILALAAIDAGFFGRVLLVFIRKNESAMHNAVAMSRPSRMRVETAL